ncbi:tetrapyrrole methylase family protein / MazG family protein [Selenomonas sp. KH1T6]|nr:tetrapyrrole methylase family protein / MazG family protein [Selenomonas ruminantium]
MVLRTAVHPTVEDIKAAGIEFTSYDNFYEQAGSFEELYRAIAEDLLRRAEREGDFLYAVPGSPLVAERTVVLLRQLAQKTDVEVEILPGMSFVEVMYTTLGIDPIEGLTIIDAEDVLKLKERPLQSLVVTQVYHQQIASDTKLALMDLYGDEYEGLYIHNLALPDESLRKIPLYELDRQPDIDHLTTFFVPKEPFFIEKP